MDSEEDPPTHHMSLMGFLYLLVDFHPDLSDYFENNCFTAQEKGKMKT